MLSCVVSLITEHVLLPVVKSWISIEEDGVYMGAVSGWVNRFYQIVIMSFPLSVNFKWNLREEAHQPGL